MEMSDEGMNHVWNKESGEEDRGLAGPGLLMEASFDGPHI
jgi:hypothetical protein